ncbi:MAG: AMP-dependent synthetase, partial [Pseudomonadota bacterium]
MVFQFERFGHQIAFQNTKEGHLSYQQLAEKCDVFQARLAGEKSLVMVHCDHSIASLIAIFGSLRAGHAVMLADAENDHLIEALKQSYTPDYIYHPQKDDLEKTHYGSAGSLHEELALLISTSGSTGSPKTVRLSYEGLVSNAEAIADYLPITASDR